MTYRYGAYPRAQRMGLVVFIAGLIILCLSADRIMYAPDKPSERILAEGLNLRTTTKAEERRSFRPPPKAFTFDPNTVSAAELQELGLSSKQAAGWLKFRGTRTNAFRRAEDIGKLYVLSDDDKARLIPLARVSVAGAKNTARRQVQGFAFDPNTVSAQDLERLGLSPKQAAAFIGYRSKAKYGRAFRKPEDIRRIRTMSDDQKDHLVALATIPPEEEKAKAPAQRFTFDPNTITKDSFQLLGFPEWQAKSLVRYRGDRATTFRRATDLRRVGALDSVLVESILDLVRIAPSTSPAPAAAPKTYAYKPKTPPPPPASFDINSSDTTAWQSLPGIGSYRAKRIVRFRDAMGGFSSVSQVAETRGLPDSTFQLIEQYLAPGKIYRPLVINRATYEELKKHPYISRNLANSIVKNREKFGRFNGPEDLSRLRLINDENKPRILPYLSFE
ncbi:helix-hairpin-helix domain-containing protein [Neolewinella aurantiaca]|uniref:Helix-hairpin-helix domain-containing protein n=1 Tax=Neolewinella aurantiaca TaxID=2602767 RepID=A0A5C7FF92_9BACT|nr:helix-hairpin-helix domain-containing protein [Neolewinella aurantiaca]TXF89834.1 helix-hairpin-helix domain-containing protein [Neolewinella aurantiaca]